MSLLRKDAMTEVVQIEQNYCKYPALAKVTVRSIMPERIPHAIRDL